MPSSVIAVRPDANRACSAPPRWPPCRTTAWPRAIRAHSRDARSRDRRNREFSARCPVAGFGRDCESNDIHVVLGEEVLLGNLPWLGDEGFAIPTELWNDVLEAGGERRDALVRSVGTAVFAACSCFRSNFGRKRQRHLRECRTLGLDVGVLTGDRRQRADRLASCSRVPVLAEQLPADKVAAIRDARAARPDSWRWSATASTTPPRWRPATSASPWAAAPICRATSAAVCLLSNDLARVPWTMALARQTVRVIQQNLCWAFSYNIVGIALAATGRLSPVLVRRGDGRQQRVCDQQLAATESISGSRVRRFRSRVRDLADRADPGEDARLANRNPQSEIRNRNSELQLTP